MSVPWNAPQCRLVTLMSEGSARPSTSSDQPPGKPPGGENERSTGVLSASAKSAEKATLTSTTGALAVRKRWASAFPFAITASKEYGAVCRLAIPFCRSIRISAVLAAGRVIIRASFWLLEAFISAVACGGRDRYKLEDALKQHIYLSIPSTMSRPNRIPLEPQRDVGRQRVAALMEAAAAVIQERGVEAATMAEIAARADAKIGSLYRFFPNKEAMADALMRHHAEILQAEYDAIHARAANATPEELADILIDLLVKLHPQARALTALLDSRTDWTEVRERLRAQ